MQDNQDQKEILKYLNQVIVVDTTTTFLFIGKLVGLNDHYLTLEDADVHDNRESPSTKEKYLIDSKKMGIRINRRLVHVRFREVISLSALEDIIEY